MLGLLTGVAPPGAGVRLRHIVGSESLRPDTDRKLDLRMETRNIICTYISSCTLFHMIPTKYLTFGCKTPI